jgi:tRNA modification GTPase
MEDTIAAIATAPGEAGIGIVRMSGKDSVYIVGKIFKSKKSRDLREIRWGQLIYGHIVNPENQQKIDEVLISIMKSPNSYTQEDVVEINCHGGVVAVRNILELVLSQGARMAQPGEFTKRAFLNGRIDLSQAEAVMDIISAKTDKGFDVALEQLEGSLSSKINTIRHRLLEMIAHIEASIDFPEDDIEDVTNGRLLEISQEIRQDLTGILETADHGKILREGLKTAIIGKPNVGKSSLLNALVKESRAIVTDVPGTTRDIIEEYINIKGVPLRIIDTAGIRETDDIVEKIGVERTKNALQEADFIMMMLDASSPLTAEDVEILHKVKDKKAIVIINKTDLPSQIDEDRILHYVRDKQIIKVSIKEAIGIEQIESALWDIAFSGEIKTKEGVMITNVRHKDALKRALHHINQALETIEQSLPVDCIAVDVKECWSILGEVTGDTLDEDIIDQIFKNFCIGK